MLRKVRFPRMVIPLSVSLTAVFNLAMNFIAVFVFALANGVYPKLSWLELIPIVGGVRRAGDRRRNAPVRALRSVSRRPADLGGPVAAAVLPLPDHLYRRLTCGRLGFEKFALLSPIAVLNTQMGHAVIGYVPLTGVARASYGPEAFPSAATAAGGYAHLLPSIAILFGLFALGWWVFIREAPRVAEHL